MGSPYKTLLNAVDSADTVLILTFSPTLSPILLFNLSSSAGQIIMQFNFFFCFLALVAIVHAAPMWAQIAKPKAGDPPSAAAPSGGVKPVTAPKQFGCQCTGATYSAATVSSTLTTAARTAANSLGAAGDTSAAKFPHTFHNYGGTLDFPLCPGAPLTEFPIKNTGIYAGGSDKGPDRVVFTTGGKFCGCIHHTDQTNFERCTSF